MNTRAQPTTQECLSLEQRIATTLCNESVNSAELTKLIREVEAAATAADATATNLRSEALDLVLTPDLGDVHQRIVNAELRRDRLNKTLPKLRAKLGDALHAEECERWFADFERVQTRADEAVSIFRRYTKHAKAITDMFLIAEKVDKEVSRINGSAPDGVHRRIRPVELQARGLHHFDRYHPSLAAGVALPCWDYSDRKVWPKGHSNSLAAAFAESMGLPYHPGGSWADADVQAQRRKEFEKQKRENAAFHKKAAAQQEARLNREERERFVAQVRKQRG